jgi:hypothetical protein
LKGKTEGIWQTNKEVLETPENNKKQKGKTKANTVIIRVQLPTTGHNKRKHSTGVMQSHLSDQTGMPDKSLFYFFIKKQSLWQTIQEAREIVARIKIRIVMKIRTAREATEVLREAREVWSRKKAWIWVQQKKCPKGVLNNNSVDLNRNVDHNRSVDHNRR